MGVEAAKHVQFDHDRLSVVIPKNTWVNIEFQKVKDPSSELIIYQPSVVAPNGQKLNSTRVQVASMDHDLAQSLEERRRSVDFLASQCESEGLDVDRDDLLRQINQAAEDDDEMLSKIAGLFCFLPERGGLYQLRLGVVNPMTDKFIEEIVTQVSVLSVPRHRYTQALEEWEGQKRFGKRSLGRRKKRDDYKVQDEYEHPARIKWATNDPKPESLDESSHDLTVGASSLDRTSSGFVKPTTSLSGFYRDKNEQPLFFRPGQLFSN